MSSAPLKQSQSQSQQSQQPAEGESRETDFSLLVKKTILRILRETTTTRTMDTDLNPSNLGTREYWDETYSTDLQNFEDTNGVDVGEIWFGFESERRILSWISKSGISKAASMLDIGSGNGSMLITLNKSAYTDLTGIDFCEAAVVLATKVAAGPPPRSIKYHVADITVSEDGQKELPHIFSRTFDVVIDKGTYDAICLSPEQSKEKRIAYMRNIAKIISADGILIITSCNWTKEELLAQFTGFDLVVELPAPQFQFGGVKGNTVTALHIHLGSVELLNRGSPRRKERSSRRRLVGFFTASSFGVVLFLFSGRKQFLKAFFSLDHACHSALRPIDSRGPFTCGPIISLTRFCRTCGETRERGTLVFRLIKEPLGVFVRGVLQQLGSLLLFRSCLDHTIVCW
ncbi:putative Protein-lysine N-methyltransferase mettl10 [Hypsibius exemplaris]|uniref:Protein-lysine N-methyltransferase BV898_01842 n=1 Tax=Hypsibius exemplaris TaxID=2072580 RepID=A0A1W0X9Y7_HYPEX|nr:putative Protein-lysine N-methyltransferase mettl10 [Hypsibius exemplaris]